jgi:hypothetical protein
LQVDGGLAIGSKKCRSQLRVMGGLAIGAKGSMAQLNAIGGLATKNKKRSNLVASRWLTCNCGKNGPKSQLRVDGSLSVGIKKWWTQLPVDV